jgi:hypothetical protein
LKIRFSSRPGRPPKRHAQNESDCLSAKLASSDANEKRKTTELNDSSILKNLNLNPNMKENLKARNLSVNIDTLTNHSHSHASSGSGNFLMGDYQYAPRIDLSHFSSHSNENRAFNNNLLKAMSIEHFANRQNGFNFDSTYVQHPFNLKQQKLTTNNQSDYNNENNFGFSNLNHAATAAAALAFYGSVFKSNLNQSSTCNLPQSGSLSKWHEYHADSSRIRPSSSTNPSILNSTNVKPSAEVRKNSNDSPFSSSISASSSLSFQKNLDRKSSEIYQLAETNFQRYIENDWDL